MKRTISAIFALCMLLASMAFAASAADTTIMGVDYAKVSTIKDLEWVRTQVSNGKTVNAILTADIKASSTSWSPIGTTENRPFLGIFDGNGKTISGLNVSTSSYSGLFGVVGKGAVVKNLTLANMTVKSSGDRAGAVAGINYGTIDGVVVESDVKVSASSFAGGVVGNNGRYGTVTNSKSYATVSSAKFSGGIAGVSTNVVTSSINYGSVSGSYAAGGIVGWNVYREQSDSTFTPSQVLSCENNGAVKVTSASASSYAQFPGDYVYAGGIVGYNQDGSINNCRNNGAVTSSNTSAYIGGVVGGSSFDSYSKYTDAKYHATVTNCINTSSDLSTGKVGGVIGYVYSSGKNAGAERSVVQNCYFVEYGKVVAVNASLSGKSTVIDVSAEASEVMRKEAFVDVLNTMNGKQESSFAWYFDANDYPQVFFGVNHGVFHIVFKVDGEVYAERMTANGRLENDVKAPANSATRTFEGWLDERNQQFSNTDVNARVYNYNVTYNASFEKLLKVTFQADYDGEIVELSSGYFKMGATPFYNETNTPAAYENETATFSFVKWDRDFAPVAEDGEVYTAEFKKTLKANDVKFFVFDKQYGETQSVKYGAAAVAPADPSVDGYRFRGWEEDFSNITAALDVHAKMVELVNVCLEFENVSKECLTVPADSTIDELPELPENDEFTCDAWLINGKLPEGPTAVVDIETIKARCSVKKYEVNFYLFSKTDKAYDSQLVEYGKDALVPADPEVEGYRFRGWEGNYTAVKQNEDVMAKMVKLVDVCLEFENVSKECVTVPADTTIELPEIPGNDEFSCDAWLVNGEVATGKVAVADIESIKARCSTKSYNVQFIVLNEKYGESQSVKYGESATAPADPYVEGYRFNNWIEDFSNITGNLDVNADMSKLTELCFVFDGATVKCDTVPVDTLVKDVEFPELPGSDSLSCTEWTVKLVDGAVASEEGVTAGQVAGVEAKCYVNTFAVRFFINGDQEGETQEVAYGASAVAPIVNEPGYRFDGWDNDYRRIIKPLDVNAIMTKLTSICFEFAGAEDCREVRADSTIKDLPELPGNDSLTCDAWLINGEVATGEFLIENIKSIEARCTVNEFDVNFFVLNEQYGETQSVKYGSAAVKPADPSVDGYFFEDWDKDFSRITAKTEVNAIMKPIVCYEFAGETVKCDTVAIDAVIELPELPGNDSLTCDAWLVNGEVAEGSIAANGVKSVVARCSVNEFEVKFFAEDEQVGKTQMVAYGSAATAPEAPEVADKRFVKWEGDYSRIIADTRIDAEYVEIDSIFVLVHNEAIDTIVVAKNETVDYKLPEVEDTEDSTFTAWKVNDDDKKAGDKIKVAYGDKIEAAFDEVQSIRTRVVASTIVRPVAGGVQISGVRAGTLIAVFDLNGHMVAQKRASNAVETLNIESRGAYLVRVGTQAQRVTVR